MGDSPTCCCCLPTPMTLARGGVFYVHLASSAVTPVGSVHKSRGDNVGRMWVQLKRCVWILHSGDGCDWRHMCGNMI